MWRGHDFNSCEYEGATSFSARTHSQTHEHACASPGTPVLPCKQYGKKEGYCKLAVGSSAQITCCALHFSRLTNKFIRSFNNSVKSLCVYMKIIQGGYASKKRIRAREKKL